MSEAVSVALISAFGLIGVALIGQIAALRRTNTQQHGRAIDALTGLRDDMHDVKAEVRAVKEDVRDLDHKVDTLRSEDVRRHEENIVHLEALDQRVSVLEPKEPQ